VDAVKSLRAVRIHFTRILPQEPAQSCGLTQAE
jgi:hypothetical protein